MKTIVLDTFYPDLRISVFIVDTFDFHLNPLFWISLLDSDQLDFSNCSKSKFKNFSASDWLFCFYNRHSDWLHFIHFQFSSQFI